MIKKKKKKKKKEDRNASHFPILMGNDYQPPLVAWTHASIVHPSHARCPPPPHQLVKYDPTNDHGMSRLWDVA